METPAQALDRELKVALARFHRLRWMLVGGVVLAIAVAVTVGSIMLVRQSHRIERDNAQIAINQEQLADDDARLLSSCDFYRPLTSLPVTVNPATGKPTELNVQIIIASREAYIGQGCTGRIPPADPSLARWAAYFRIPVRG